LAFISVLSGNDYLPKLRGFHIEKVWNSYMEARANNTFAPTVPLYDTPTRTINADFLAHLLKRCAETPVREPSESKNARSALATMLQKYLSVQLRKEEASTAGGVFVSRVYVDDVLLAEAEAGSVHQARLRAAKVALGLSETDEPSIDSPLYRLLAERVPSLEAKSYLSNLKRFLPSEEELNAPPPSEQVLKDAVADYLKGVVWVMEYLGGSCNDYGYRYTSALNPSVAHIRQHAASVPLSFTFKSDARPLAPLPFFLSLMPPNSQDALKFVPAEFKHLLAPDSPVADLVRTCLMELLAALARCSYPSWRD
jgi:5'-3' exonuclease